MTSPSWAPPPTPEQPTLPVAQPKRTRTSLILLASLVVIAMFLAGASYFFVKTSTTDPARPEHAVAALLDDLANGRWISANGRFGSECSDLSAEILAAQFGPLMDNYESHSVSPVADTDPGQDGFVRVIGSLETAGGVTNSVRADVRAAASSPNPSDWEVCGMQIYGP